MLATSNRTVYKYCPPNDDTKMTITIPSNARILHVGAQRLDSRKPTVWAEIDDIDSSTVVELQIVGTGWPVPDDHEYCGTAICDGGYLVWHVYRPQAKVKT